MNLKILVIVVFGGISSAAVAQAACTNSLYHVALNLCAYTTQLTQYATSVLPELFSGPLTSNTTESLSNYCSTVTSNVRACSDDLIDNCLAVNQQILNIRFTKAYAKICELDITLQSYKTLFDCENKTHWFYYFQQYQAEIINNVTAQYLPSNADLEAIIQNAECRVIQLYKEQIPDMFINQQCGEDAERTFATIFSTFYEAFRCGQPKTTAIPTPPTRDWSHMQAGGSGKPAIHALFALAMLFVVFRSMSNSVTC